MRRKKEQPKEPVRIINVMADGTVCEDLSTYLSDHELPETAKIIIVDMIRRGHQTLLTADCQ